MKTFDYNQSYDFNQYIRNIDYVRLILININYNILMTLIISIIWLAIFLFCYISVVNGL